MSKHHGNTMVIVHKNNINTIHVHKIAVKRCQVQIHVVLWYLFKEHREHIPPKKTPCTLSVCLFSGLKCADKLKSFKYLSLPPSFSLSLICASSPGFVLLISNISGISYLWPPASNKKCDHIQLCFVKCLALFSWCWVSVKLWNDIWKGLTYLKKDRLSPHTHTHIFI